MSRVALVAGPDPGHAFPVVALALALRRRGHDTLVVTGPQWRAGIERDGVEWCALAALPPDERHGDFGFRMWGQGQALGPQVADALGPWRPDLVVADVLSTPGAFAAGLLGLPWVEVQPHPLVAASRALPPPGSGLAPGRGPLGHLRDATLRRMHARSAAAGDAARRSARRALGLPEDDPPRARLVATLPALEPARPDWPADAHIVGALEWDPADEELAPPPGDGPLVLVTDSTASGRRAALLPAAVEGMAGTEVRIVSTRFAPWDAAVPAGVAIGPGRQAPLLDRAAAVVCPGGHGLLGKALTRGVPCVVVPGAGDQKDNAARVARAGAGVVLRPDRLTPERLRAAVREVLRDNGYRAAAGRVADSARGLGAGYAGGVVESVLGASS